MKPLYIFDLDGTLALNDHRKHFIADKKNQRWDDFYRACVDDVPNKPVIRIMEQLLFGEDECCGQCRTKIEPPSDIKIFSGRSIIVLNQTIKWLSKNTLLGIAGEPYCASILYMRKQGDSTPDQILKAQWYNELSQQDKDRLICVFDDRQKVVDMWRSIGVTCLQVAKGDF